MTFPLFQFANLSLVLTPIERRHGRQHGRCQAAGSGSGSGADSVSQIRQAPLHSTPICTRCLPTNPICNLPPISYRSPPPRPFPFSSFLHGIRLSFLSQHRTACRRDHFLHPSHRLRVLRAFVHITLLFLPGNIHTRSLLKSPTRETRCAQSHSFNNRRFPIPNLRSFTMQFLSTIFLGASALVTYVSAQTVRQLENKSHSIFSSLHFATRHQPFSNANFGPTSGPIATQ